MFIKIRIRKWRYVMKNKVYPISPNEAMREREKQESFPDDVFESFNELIVQNFVEGSASFKEIEVIKLMRRKGLMHEEMYNKGWLFIEDRYRLAGWEVKHNLDRHVGTINAGYTFTANKR
jgi:hypothetical protein